MAEIEAVADAITGGVLGRTVEPAAGEGYGHTHEANCLNCGTTLIGPHCHRCGQHSHVHRSLGAFFHDFAHGVFHLEGKLWRTIPLLVWKPGDLTRRYIDGQRASFVSPIALFLFCVFLMFSVVEMSSPTINTNFKGSKDLASEIQADRQKIAALEQQRAAATKAGKSTDDLDDQITALNGEITGLQVATARINVKTVHDGRGVPHWLQKLSAKAAEDPQLLFFKLKTDAYKFSWALIPFSAPLVWLLFPFSRRFGLYDHTVFVTYSLCFMMLLLSAGTLVGLISGAVANLFWFIPPVHMFRQLRGAYGVSVAGALWRTFALVVFAWTAICLFASLLLTIGLLD